MRALLRTGLCAGVLLAGGAAAAVAAPASETILVKVPDDATASERAAISARLGAEEVTPLLRGWRAYRLSDPRTVVQARRALSGLPAERIEADQPVYAAAISDDPFSDFQSHLARIRAKDAWDLGASAARPAQVTVGVIDTGVLTLHPDLLNRVWTNPGEGPLVNGVDDDGNGYVDDYWGMNVDSVPTPAVRNGDVIGLDTLLGTPIGEIDDVTDARHGTHVAGLVAAQRGNYVGVAGVADNARILTVRFMRGAQRKGNVSDGIEGIRYAVQNGARVINLDWALEPGTSSQALCQAILEAGQGESGAVVVAAAGNHSADIDAGVAVAPASCPAPNLISVAATDADTDALAAFSNTGRRSLDVAAPGTQLNTALGVDRGLISLHPSLRLLDRAGVMSGTSMSAPQVSGVAAMILGHRPDLSPRQVVALIRTRGTSVAGLETTTLTGRRLDAHASLAAALALPSGGEPTPAVEAATPPADAVASTAPTFSWSSSGANPIEYRLVVDGVVVRALPGSARSATVPELTEGVHTWRVESTTGSAATAPRIFTLDATPPEPFEVRAEAVGDRVHLSWDEPRDAVSGVEAIGVYRGDAAIASFPAGARVIDAGPLPAPGTADGFRVEATDRAGNVRRMSLEVVTNQAAGVPGDPGQSTTPPGPVTRTLRVAAAGYPRRYEVRARTSGGTTVVARGRLAARARVVRVRLSAAMAERNPVLRVRTVRMYSTARTRAVSVRAAAVPRRYTVTARSVSTARVVARGTLPAGARTVKVRLSARVAAEGPRLVVAFRKGR